MLGMWRRFIDRLLPAETCIQLSDWDHARRFANSCIGGDCVGVVFTRVDDGADWPALFRVEIQRKTERCVCGKTRHQHVEQWPACKDFRPPH